MKGQQIIIITLLLVGCKLNGFSFPAGTVLTPIFLIYHLGSLGLAFTLIHPSISLARATETWSHHWSLFFCQPWQGTFPKACLASEGHPCGEEGIRRDDPWWMKWKSEEYASHRLLWWLSSKESACSVGVEGDAGSIPGSGRFPWRKKWHPSPVFLPGESHGPRSLAGYHPQGRKEADVTEVT